MSSAFLSFSTCDADRARELLQYMFERTLPYSASESPERIDRESITLMDDDEARQWLGHVMCQGYFISWRFDMEDRYVPCIRS